MDAGDLKKRTKEFGLRVIRLVNALPSGKTSNIIGNQLLRSATSVGANYRAACRGQSRPDFIAKVNIAIEEADESLYWIEMLADAGIVQEDRISALIKEANELVAILTASSKTA